MGVEAYPVAHLAAQQFVDGFAQRLATDIPERDVNAADHRTHRPSGAHIGKLAEQLVPQGLDARRVLPNDQLRSVSYHSRNGLVGHAPRIGRDLAPAGEALVGLYLDKDVLPVPGLARRVRVRPGRADQPRCNASYFHYLLLSG